MHDHHHHEHHEHSFEGVFRALHQMEHRIMTAITDFLTKQTEFNTKLTGFHAELLGDITELGRQIAVLQGSQGTVTPEDQATIDQIEISQASLAQAFQTLGDMTPPVVPAPGSAATNLPGTRNPDGSTTNSDGSITNADGSQRSPASRSSARTSDRNADRSVTNPDGSRTVTNADGSKTMFDKSGKRISG